MRARYGPNKPNDLIIQARVTKRQLNMLIYIDKEKTTSKCQRKAKQQEYKHVKSKIIKKVD